jgi:uncharacterized protein YecA (UPF0149 family)
MGGNFIMEQTMSQEEKQLVCTVKTDLQAAQIAKICQYYGLQSIIKIKSFVDISQVKKAVKEKQKEMMYDPCPCGIGKKFKFCCYEKASDIKLY